VSTDDTSPADAGPVVQRGVRRLAPERLEQPDLKVILAVYRANATFGIDLPFLVSPRQQKRARALAARGLLKAGSVRMAPNPEGFDGYMVTQAGIDAYNSALARHESPNA